MVEFNSAWNYISKDWNKTLKFIVFGAILVFVPILGQLVLMGLSLKIISNAINKKNEVPEVFDDFGNNLVEGLKLFLFQLIFGLIFSLIVFVPLGGSIMQIFNASLTGDETVILNTVFGMLGILVPVLLIVGILAAILMPALTCNYAKEKKFSAFFDFKKAFSLVFNKFGAFLSMIVVNFVYIFVISLLGGLLSITFVGAILTAPAIILITNKVVGDWFLEVNKK